MSFRKTLMLGFMAMVSFGTAAEAGSKDYIDGVIQEIKPPVVELIKEFLWPQSTEEFLMGTAVGGVSSTAGALTTSTTSGGTAGAVSSTTSGVALIFREKLRPDAEKQFDALFLGEKEIGEEEGRPADPRSVSSRAKSSKNSAADLALSKLAEQLREAGNTEAVRGN